MNRKGPMTPTGISRRTLLRRGGTLAAGFALGFPRPARAAPRVEIDASTVISLQPYYHGWPTLGRRRNGELLVVFSGGREAHICPFGRVELMRSKDEGRTWTFPRVLFDGPLDDRDAGVLETARGTILVSSFTSVGYEERLAVAESMKPDDQNRWSNEQLKRWRAAHARISAAQREVELKSFILRSTDGGRTWSAPRRCPVNAPHGPIQLRDGRVLYAGKLFWQGRSDHGLGHVGVCESTDDGVSWRWLAEIPTRPGDKLSGYHELHAVETSSGTLIAHIRNHNPRNEREILQSESTDGGETWSVPRPIGVWGFPSHLVRLRDDRLVMSYGHRRMPLGVQARVSEDQGRTWSEPVFVARDGTSSDIGYPSTVQLTDGSLLTLWYELMGSVPEDYSHYLSKSRDEAWFKMTEKLQRAVLRQARWQLG